MRDTTTLTSDLLERERERESGGAIGGESQGVNVVVGLVCTTKGWDIDCQ